MDKVKATAHQERLGRETSSAMENYARRHSAALVLFLSEDHVDVGSSTCVQIGGRFFLITAGHNIENVESTAIRIVASQTSSADWMSILGKNWAQEEGQDIGWIEIEQTAARESDLDFLAIESLRPFEQPSDDSLYLVQGLPAELATTKERVISLASLGFMTIPAEEENIHYDYDPGIELILEYSDANWPLPIPKGMSGGGIWSIPNNPELPVWAPENSKLVGVVRGWREGSRHLSAVRIEHWLRLIRLDFPELQNEVDRVLSENRN